MRRRVVWKLWSYISDWYSRMTWPSMPVRGKSSYPLPNLPDRCWDPPRLLANGNCGPFMTVKKSGSQVVPFLHLVQRLRMSVAVILILLRVFKILTSTSLQFCLSTLRMQPKFAFEKCGIYQTTLSHIP